MPKTKINHNQIKDALIHGADQGVTGDGATDDTAAVQATFALTSAYPNKVAVLQADNFIKYTHSGSATVNTSNRLTQTSDIVGLADTINTDWGTTFITGESGLPIDSPRPLGIARKYIYTSGDVSLQNGIQLDFNVDAQTGPAPTSAAGLGVKTKLNVTDATAVNFSWHNIFSIVESNAGQGHEPAAAYFGSYTTAGATPWGLIIDAISTGAVAPNHVYGQQIVIGSVTQPGVSSKALSLWSTKDRQNGYGVIAWGEAGWGNAFRATTESDRAEAEASPGGDIGVGFIVDQSTTQKVLFNNGSVAFAAGDVVTNASGGTATLTSVRLLTGSWAGGNAAGYIYSKNPAGTWTNAGDAIAGVPSGGTAKVLNAAGWIRAGTISVGFQAKYLTEGNAYEVVEPGHGTLPWFVSGGGAQGGHFLTIPDTPGLTTFSVINANRFETPFCSNAVQLATLSGGVQGQEIMILGGGGGAPTVVKNGTGNITLSGGDWTAAAGKILKLVYHVATATIATSTWYEVSRT